VLGGVQAEHAFRQSPHRQRYQARGDDIQRRSPHRSARERRQRAGLIRLARRTERDPHDDAGHEQVQHAADQIARSGNPLKRTAVGGLVDRRLEFHRDAKYPRSRVRTGQRSPKPV
jgi:hypothetical protein